VRVPIIAGNWKMHGTRGESVALATAIAAGRPANSHVEVVVAPPSCYLDCVAHAVQGSGVKVAAQNAHHERQGAFTGEMSAAMALDLGANYVILGHSERRTLFGESDPVVNRKLLAVLDVGLVPIVCLGELLEQRESGRTAEVVRQQFTGSCAGLTPQQMQRVVLAYEPVWAIGTGRVATPDQAEEVHAQLRQLITEQYGRDVAGAVRIQYGGSVNAANAAELLNQPNVDGALVGGASLKAESFLVIVAAAQGTSS